MATIAIIPDRATTPKKLIPSPSTSSLKHKEQATEKPEAPSKISNDRKQLLLLEARRARVSWVDASRCPFRNSLNQNKTTSLGLNSNGENGLSLLQSVRACQSMTSAVDVVKELYSSTYQKSVNKNQSVLDSSTYERIRNQLDNQITTNDIDKVLSSSIPGTEICFLTNQSKLSNDNNSTKKQDVDFSLQYSMFLQKLRSPECAEFVQGMRNFVHSFVDMANDTVATNSLPVSMQNYLQKLYSDFHCNILWKNGQNNDDEHFDNSLNRSIETFMYSKCYDTLWSVLSSDNEMKTKDQKISDKIIALQFITPIHLEVEYLMTTTEEESKENLKDNWKEILAQPTQTLQSIDHQFSPGRMLDCILKVYREVNVVLKKIMQQKYKSDDKLPGADDLMPALILTVLNAKPNQIASNLNFIENFATPDQLMGEAGYAFTNLYGAVQFISDLSLNENENSESTSISSSFLISPKEFRTGLQQCRDATNKNLQESKLINKTKRGPYKDINDKLTREEEKNSSLVIFKEVLISANDVRAARLRGETIDLNWARRWRENLLDKIDDDTTSRVGDEIDQHSCTFSSNVDTKRLEKSCSSPAQLPEGFTRSYKYLASKPDDIRISDIPSLLKEYQMLVKATESLLAERSARQNEEYKKQIHQARKRLECNAAEAVLSISTGSL